MEAQDSVQSGNLQFSEFTEVRFWRMDIETK